MPGDVPGLALADVIRSGWFIEFLDDGIDHLRTGGGGELAEFIKRILDIPAAHSIVLETDEDGLLAAGGRSADHQAGPGPERAGSKTNSLVFCKPVKSIT